MVGDIYEILVEGHLNDGWSEGFGGMTIVRQGDGNTLLVGKVVDQAALHGLLARIRDLGLPLLGVSRPEAKGS